jgi:hypothetical protein
VEIEGSNIKAESFVRKLGKAAVSLLVGTIIGLVLLELIVRIVEPRTMGVYVAFQDDPVLNHRLPPNTKGKLIRTDFETDFHTNSLGLRDREFAIPKPPKTFRILMLGDSFTAGEGVNVEQTFSKRLESVLNKHVAEGERIEVVNAGVGSYSPLLEFLYLRYDGLQLEPDLVILNMDLSDLYDDIQYSAYVQLDDHGVPIAVPPGRMTAAHSGISLLSGMFAGVKDFLKEHTHLYNFIRFRIYLYSERKKREGDREGDLRYDKLAQLRPNYHNRGDSDWALTFKYILLMRDTLQRRNIDFWMTLYPYGMQVNGREWSEGRKYWGFEPDTVYSTWPQERMEKFCRQNGIEVLNMCNDFKHTSTHQPLYLVFDGHWTPAGHDLAARLLYRKLVPYLYYRGTIRDENVMYDVQ